MGFLKKVGRALKKAGNALVSGLRQLGNLLNEFIQTVFGALDFVLALLVILPMKKIRVAVVVLRDENGVLLADPPSNLGPRISAASDILERQAKTRIVAPGIGQILPLPDPAPTYALDVKCGAGAWGEEFGEAGAYFRGRTVQAWHGAFFGYGDPVTAFLVRSVDGDDDGCSLGPLTSYVTVEAEDLRIPGDDVGGGTPGSTVGTVNSRLLAHEVAHACGLPHWFASTANLMHPSGPGTRLSRFQKAVFRRSRHVTYL